MRKGDKAFEYRKNDRDYKVGDVLRLREWNPDTEYTGEIDLYRVTWILYEGFGLPLNYCIMSVKSLTSSGEDEHLRGYQEGWEEGEYIGRATLLTHVSHNCVLETTSENRGYFCISEEWVKNELVKLHDSS